MRSQVLAAAVAVLVLLGCGGSPSGGEVDEVPRATRGYILISLDTLRADHLGCYGYERDTSPFLDSLAERAVLFENAIAQFPSTLTSHMSIFTGLYPGEHGVYPPDSVLEAEIETLPELFQRHGFRTAGFTEGGYVHGRFGFRRGFDTFAARDRRGRQDTERTFERGLDFLRRLGGGDRFFLFLHTYAVHAPYEPPERYRKLFWEGETPAGAFPPTGPELSRHNALGARLSAEVRDYFEALYDAEIRHLDDVLRSFFDELESLGLADDTTVIVTSDHGEEFQEHGKMNHTQLYREVLRVPLLVVHPDFEAPRRHAPPVSSVDIAPTFYQLARLEPRTAPSGSSLAPVFDHVDEPEEASTLPADAYSEAGDARSLFLYHEGRFDHLVVFQPPSGRWWTRRLTLAVNGPVSLEIRSYEDERPLEVRRGGETVVRTTIGPEWTRLDVDLPIGQGRRRIELVSPDCTMAEDSEDLKRVRCYSFQVRGISLGRAELYALPSDPAEAVDLSDHDGDRVRLLYPLLAEYPGKASRRPSKSEALDEKLRKELEALGYLQ